MVITDVKLPDGDGIEILRHVKSASPQTVVIVMTAFGSTETAVAALKLGAHDYLVKPFDVEELKIVVRGALESQQLKEENLRLRAELERPPRRRAHRGHLAPDGGGGGHGPLRGPHRAPRCSSRARAARARSWWPRPSTASRRARDAPFVSINCGALPENLLESEMFGHVRGAFTDAHQNKKGLFEAAHRGTLFLDEVGEMPPAMQVKLLRALQERTIRRVGGTEEIEVDVRVIAATNRNLETLVQEKQLREDLYLPPERHPHPAARRCGSAARTSRILARNFLERFGRDADRRVTQISERRCSRLVAYPWPGNVRELENVIERAVALETTRHGHGRAAARAASPPGRRRPGGADRARQRVQPGRAPRTASSRTWSSRPSDKARGDRRRACAAPRRHPAVAPVPHPEARPARRPRGDKKCRSRHLVSRPKVAGPAIELIDINDLLAVIGAVPVLLYVWPNAFSWEWGTGRTTPTHRGSATAPDEPYEQLTC